MAARLLGDAADLVDPLLDPPYELPSGIQPGRPEDGRPRHPDVLHVHPGSAGGADRRAAPVRAGHERGLRRGERHIDFLIHMIASHVQGPHDAHRDLRHTDEVLAVSERGPVRVEREVPDVFQTGAGQPLEGLPPDLRLNIRRKIALEARESRSPPATSAWTSWSRVRALEGLEALEATVDALLMSWTF